MPLNNLLTTLKQQERERISQLYRPQTHNLVPADNKLLIFRSLTGIDHVPVLSKDGFFQPRNAPNVGIYTRVVQAEKTATLRYRCFSILINTCLSVQIVVAAALTAAQGPHGVITAFGAINTIMAGILTYLRGTGLPDSEKNIEKAWRQIREHIEQREREFCLEGCMLNVEDEIRTIEHMYEEVRLQMEPGNSESGGFRGASRSIDTLRDIRGRSSLLQNGATADAVKEAVARHPGVDGAKATISAESGRVEDSLRGRLGQYGENLRHTSDHVRQTGENVRHTGESRFDQFRDGLQQVREHFQHSGDQARSAGESHVGHLRDELRHVGDYFRHQGESIQRTGEDIRHTGENIQRSGEEQLLSTREHVQQTGDNLRNPEIRVSIQSNSKETQTDKDFQC